MDIIAHPTILTQRGVLSTKPALLSGSRCIQAASKPSAAPHAKASTKPPQAAAAFAVGGAVEVSVGAGEVVEVAMPTQ